jgi:leucyl aminopeptidase (aminopeptidase T)
VSPNGQAELHDRTRTQHLGTIDPVKLDRLAEVAIKVGLSLKPGQDLLLTAPSVALPLVRRIAYVVTQISHTLSST